MMATKRMWTMHTQGNWHYVAEVFPPQEGGTTFGWAVTRFDAGSTVAVGEDKANEVAQSNAAAESRVLAELDRVMNADRKPVR